MHESTARPVEKLCRKETPYGLGRYSAFRDYLGLAKIAGRDALKTERKGTSVRDSLLRSVSQPPSPQAHVSANQEDRL
jgi:hypothetical protein